MTPQEFAAKIKAKYPVYANMDDTELAQKIVAKYPVYASQVSFQAPEQPKDTVTKVFEGIGNFTGGTKIAQGLGQAIAQPEIAKGLKETQSTQQDIQGKLIQQIKQFKSQGKDTSRLDHALTLINQDVRDTGNNAGDLLNPNKLTTKQVLGDALQLGTTVLGAGQIPGVAKSATGAPGIVKGAIQGAKSGAIAGGIYGASSGASQALKSDKSSQEIGQGLVLGALGGAVTGGALGGITGGISGGIKSYQTAKTNQDFIDKMITPDLKGKPGLAAIKSGKVAEGAGLTGKRNITGAVQNFNEIKQSVAQVPGIAKGNTNLQNLNAIHEAIGTTAQDLQSQLQDKGSFTPSQFNKYMTTVRGSLSENPSIVGDSAKSADKILAKFNSLVKENGYTPSGLLDARKQLDTWIGGQKSNVFNPSTDNAISIALRAIRQGGNNFLADLVPDVAVKDLLRHQSNLYTAIDTLAPKILKEAPSKLSRATSLIKAHPLGSTITGLVTGVVGGETVRKVIGL